MAKTKKPDDRPYYGPAFGPGYTPTVTTAVPAGQDLTSYAAGLNVNVSPGGGVLDPSDPDVYVGHPLPEFPGQRDTRKSSDVYVDFYRLPADTIRALQERFFKAGLYGKATRDDIPWGTRDDDTYNLWRGFVDQTARQTSAGQRLTVWDVIADYETHAPAAAAAAQAGPKRQPLVIRLTNPDDLGPVYEKITEARLGRKPTPAETQEFVAAFQAAQRSAQTGAYNLDETGGTTVDEANPAAFATARVDAAAPQEAQTYGMFQNYQRALDFLTHPQVT